MSQTSGYPSRFMAGWYSPYNTEASSPLAIMSTTPKYNVRTNRQTDPFEVTGDRTPQGEVTINLLVNPDLHKARQETGKIARTKGIQTMGTLVNLDNIQIVEGDLVFVPMMQRTNNGSLFGSTKDPLAFSSFTGINASTELFANQEQFEGSFQFAGKTKVPYKLGSPEQAKSGISVFASGATTINNHGVETFAFGDAVCWYTYSALDDQLRENQIMTMRLSRGAPPEKFGALLKRLTGRDIYKQTQNAIERYIVADENGRGAEFLTAHFRDKLPSKREFDALRRHFRAECVQSTAVDAWLAIVTLQQLGIVTINLPDPGNANFANIVTGLKDVNLQDHKKENYTPLAAGTNFTPGKDPRPGTRENNWKKSLSLAHLLNVAKDNTGNAAPLASVMKILIMRKYRGLLETQNTYKHRGNASILHTGPDNLLENGMPPPSTVAQTLDHLQLNSVREADAEFYALYRAVTKQIIGKSLSTTSEAGGHLDILF